MVLAIGDGERFGLGIQVKIYIGKNALQIFHHMMLLSLLGDNQNWDIIPFCTIDLGDDSIEMKSPKQ